MARAFFYLEQPTACFFSPFAPAAERYALTCVKSIICVPSTDLPTNANRFSRNLQARNRK